MMVGKCMRIHGHRYEVCFEFSQPHRGHPQRNAVLTTFEEYDSKIEPLIKDYFDHRMFVDVNDYELRESLQHITNGITSVCMLPFPSSVENVAFMLFHLVHSCLRFDSLTALILKETDTSTLHYSRADYRVDETAILSTNDGAIPGTLAKWINDDSVWSRVALGTPRP